MKKYLLPITMLAVFETIATDEKLFALSKRSTEPHKGCCRVSRAI